MGNVQKIKTTVDEILSNELPSGIKYSVSEREFMGDVSLAISMWVDSEYVEHNGHCGQVSYSLFPDTWELQSQVYGGIGGGRISVKTDDTRFYCEGIKIPFRKPRKTEDAVIKALHRLCENYISTIRSNFDKLIYVDRVLETTNELR